MRYYWMEHRVKQKYFYNTGNQDSKTWVVDSQIVTNKTTLDKYIMHTYIWKIPY